MKGHKEVLDKYKWHPDLDLNDLKIVIEHRGAPDDKKIIEGRKVFELDSGFMKIKGTYREVKIPYHRIIKIVEDGEVIWESVS